MMRPVHLEPWGESRIEVAEMAAQYEEAEDFGETVLDLIHWDERYRHEGRDHSEADKERRPRDLFLRIPAVLH
jgi:hypothetical protein